MPYDPTRHHRRSIRLPHYDYAAPGWYFVTICTHHRACLFGEVEDGAVRLSPAGAIVQAAWDDLPTHYPHVRLDAFVVMPNHVHGIVGIIGNDGGTGNDGVGAPLVGALPAAEPSRARAGTRPAPTSDIPFSLGDVVGAFKSLTTNAYIRGVRTQGWPPFDRRLWQRNYWERIIRTDRELANVRRYITENPLRWNRDRLYPDRPTR